MAKEMDKEESNIRRFEETGSPIFVITHNIKKFCHALTEQTEEGEVVDLKMRPTKPFLVQFNERVFDILAECIQTARSEGRTELMAKDAQLDNEEEDNEED